ncbi:MAG: cation diffusion facilitator family transporter [Methanobacterium sp.]|nr:cation diffusion facilitator family transporter [Methanobacterium sp.]
MKKIDYTGLKKGEKAAEYSVIANFALAIVKTVVGVLSGSIALLADAVHSFSDIFSSLAVYIGLKLSQRKPDEKFPYGYYKFETLSSIIISVIIIISGFEIAMESLNGIITPKPINMPLIAITVAFISAVVSFLLTRLKDNVGREINSPALINDGKHSFVDIFSSFIVFFGILTAYIGYPIFQGVAGFTVAILIIYMGIKSGKEALLILLDANLDSKVLEKIKAIAISFEGVKGIHNIKIRRSGPYIFAELHVETDINLSLQKVSTISKSMEQRIKNEVNDLNSIIIKIEPKKKFVVRIAIPIDKDKGLNSVISKHFGKAPYFLVVDVNNDNIKNSQLMKNPAATFEQKKWLKTVKFLKNKEVNILLFNGKINEGPSYALSDELITVIIPHGDNLKDIILEAALNYRL